MFPLNANDPYINKNGSRTTLGDITGDISGIEADIDTLDGRLDILEDKTESVADSITPVSQTGTKATAAITTGAYFFLNGDLVKAKVDIAIDDTFTENTNYEKVTTGGLDDLKGMIDTVAGSIKLKRVLVPANDSASYNYYSGTVLFIAWSTTEFTISCVTASTVNTAVGTLPSGAAITADASKFTITNPKSFAAVLFYMSNF